MTTRLGLPPDPLPAVRPADTVRIGITTDIGRVYFAAGRHPQTWDSFRSYGPLPRMRFDHHPEPLGPYPSLGISYQAPARGRRGRRNDPLETCVREIFAGTNLVDLHTDEPWFALWRPTRPLVLLDVVDGPWIARARGNGAISTGPRAIARRWSRAIHASYPDVDGIFFQASTLLSHRSVALYERARSALPATYRLAMPLDHPGLRNAMRRIAYTYGMDLTT